MTNRNTTTEDPRAIHPGPPFDEPRQRHRPGMETEMRNKPDHGEESYQGHGRLKERVALITGGDSGIGRAVAIAFAREGAHVAFGYLPKEEADAKATVEWVEKAGRRVLALPGDVRDEDWCRAMVEQTVSELGRLDILVNNAAYQATHESIDEWSSKEWDHTFRTNIYSMYYLARAAFHVMKAGGVIVNTASVQAYQPSGPLLAYATTKGAIVTFTKALAKLASEKGIRVNAVAPGPVWTPLIPSTMPAEKVEHFGQDGPLARPAQPAELAPAYVFLASAESSYVTGAVMDMTGGKMLP